MKDPSRNLRLPIWVCLELGEVVDGTQQSGCDQVFPATPGLGCTWVPDVDVLICIYHEVVTLTGWEILFWDERDNVHFDALCIRLSGLGRN